MFALAAETARTNPGLNCDAAAFNSAAGTRGVLRSKPSNLRAYSIRALSPRLRTFSRMGRTTSSASVKRAALRASSLPICDDSITRIMNQVSHHDLIERILHDSLSTGLFQAGNDDSYRRLVEN